MRKIVALLGALALVAALGGTAAESAPSAKKSRLVRFNSCGQLLSYAKSHARPLVTAYGLGVTGMPVMEAAAGVPTTGRAAPVASSPV